MLTGKRLFSCLAGTALAASLAACGGGDGGGGPTTPATPVPTPTPCTQTTIVQDSGGIPGKTLVYDDFSVPDSGRLDVTMDWTFTDSLIGFYLVPANTCTIDEFNAKTCNFLIRSEVTTKPRKISTSDFAAGNYRWMIGNYSDVQESVSLQIVLSKGNCPTLGGGPSASQRTDESWPALERAQRH
jgi:hypothetical protein